LKDHLYDPSKLTSELTSLFVDSFVWRRQIFILTSST